MFNTQAPVLAPDGTPLLSLVTGELWSPTTGMTLVPVFDRAQAVQLAQAGTPVYGLPATGSSESLVLVPLAPSNIALR